MFMTNNVFLDKKIKPQQQKTQQNENIKLLARTWNRTQYILHRSLIHYLYSTEATKQVDWTQAIQLLQRNVLNMINKQSQICRSHFF